MHTKNNDHMMYDVPEIRCAMDVRTNGRTKKVTCRGGCTIQSKFDKLASDNEILQNKIIVAEKTTKELQENHMYHTYMHTYMHICHAYMCIITEDHVIYGS